jgi:putative transposase
MFELFDFERPFAVRRGNLPHWFQPGVTYFVTFRTEDSVPQDVVRKWHQARAEWLRAQDIDVRDHNWKKQLAGEPKLENEFNRTFTRQFMEYLDRGYGACPLRDEAAAEIVASSLRHFDGERYHLGDFVVMPNHVHVLVGLVGDTEIEAQCESWKRYTALELNRRLGRKGRFWQEESFDHLVRSGDQFEALRRYIADNPKRAGLREGEYLYYRRPL